MIITKEGTIVMAVGDVFVFDGRVYSCEVDTGVDLSGECERCVGNKYPWLCSIMECGSNRRGDGLSVSFKPFGEKEGGEG